MRSGIAKSPPSGGTRFTGAGCLLGYGNRSPQQRPLGQAEVVQAAQTPLARAEGGPPQRPPSGRRILSWARRRQKRPLRTGVQTRDTSSDPRRRKKMAGNELHETAKALVVEGKGILAADVSDRTIKKRFDSIGVESTEELRRAYRDLLFTTDGADEFISGVILFDETIRQSSADGTPFPKLLESNGIIPGIKVDKGAKPLALAEGETITEGLDGLRARLEEYRELGARFAKWRATYSISASLPSDYCIWTNAHALARYAALCQEAGLVPIVEPEVLMDGTHTIERAFHVTSRVLGAVYTELFDQKVALEGTLLKPNMVLSGYDASDRASVDEVADWTLKCFYRHVPAAVPGIVFLSGGQSDEDATAHFNAMNKRGPHPWELSFSYGRALQAPSLKAWRGEQGNVEAAQKAFYRRAKFNGAARSGSYAPEMEREAAAV